MSAPRAADPGRPAAAAGIDAPDQHGFTALHHAALAGLHDKVAGLLAPRVEPPPTTVGAAPFRP